MFIINRLKEVYQYRFLLWSMTKSELRTRYKGSALGFLWTFINPLLQLLVYTFIFSIILKSDIKNYPVFLFVGLLPWNMFTSAVQGSCGVIVGKSSLVKKIYFPREVLPFSLVGAAAINYILSLIILIPFLFLTGYYPNIYWLYFPVFLLVESIFSAGLALFFSSINVYMRDTEHMLNIFMMLWFYITPVVYSLNLVPHKLNFIFKIDPISSAIMCFQQIFYYETAPHWKLAIYTVLSSLLFLYIGWFVFNKLNRRFAEEI